MELTTWQEYIGKEDISDSTRNILEAWSLPPRYYTDPAVFEAEKEAIFLKEWMCVGRVEQIPNPGDYFSCTVVGEPLIIVRGKDHKVGAMSAVCRHRGMVITAPSDGEFGDWYRKPEETKGTCTAFKCPFHFWTYDLDGRLVGAPEMGRSEGFRREEIRLPAFAVETWKGFIFVNFSENPAPLAPQLHHLDEIFKNWRIEEMRGGEPTGLAGMPCNWKILQDQAEAYHVDRLHFPLHRVMPADGLIAGAFEIPEGSGGIPFAVRTIHPDYGLNPVGKALLPTIETLSEEERQVSVWAFVLPSLIIGAVCDSAFYRIVHPVAVDRTDIWQSYLAPESHHQMPLFHEILEMQESFHLRLNHQDYMTAAAVQRGLSSKFATQGRLGWQEEVLVHFYRWLAVRYRQHGM